VTTIHPAIDCDVHPAAPGMRALLPYLDEYWRESVIERGVPSLETNSYPAHAPISARPEFRGNNGLPDATVGRLTDQVFGRWQAQRAICNCLYGVELSGDRSGGRVLCGGIVSGPAGEQLRGGGSLKVAAGRRSWKSRTYKNKRINGQEDCLCKTSSTSRSHPCRAPAAPRSAAST
jgi:hypothetical protein